MKRTNIGSTLAIVTLLGIAGTANGAVIYNNGGPDTVPPQTGLPIGPYSTADDFTLAAGAAIQSVGFYLQADAGIAGWSQSVNYDFMSDAGGVPGAILASGAAQNVVETDSGLPWCCSREHAYLVNFDLQNRFTANAGTTYWLQLIGATAASGSVYWVTTAGGIGTNPAFYEGGNSASYQVAFYLSGATLGTQAPEPGGMALAGLGFVALALVRRGPSRRD
jgi:PEP-CTERM motif